jgi:hypothetical protein
MTSLYQEYEERLDRIDDNIIDRNAEYFTYRVIEEFNAIIDHAEHPETDFPETPVIDEHLTVKSDYGPDKLFSNTIYHLRIENEVTEEFISRITELQSEKFSNDKEITHLIFEMKAFVDKLFGDNTKLLSAPTLIRVLREKVIRHGAVTIHDHDCSDEDYDRAAADCYSHYLHEDATYDDMYYSWLSKHSKEDTHENRCSFLDSFGF